MKKLSTIFWIVAGVVAIWFWINFGRALLHGDGAQLVQRAKEIVARAPPTPSGWYGAYDPESRKTLSYISIWIGPEGVAKVKALIFELPATWRLQNRVLFVEYTNMDKEQKQSRYMVRDDGTLFDVDSETIMKPFEK
jgi:hypothetical protein